MFQSWFAAHEAVAHRWLRELHAHPEVGFEEHRTAAFVADRLRSFGLEVETGIGGTGVVGLLRGQRKPSHGRQRLIGLRAELDALPMREQAAVNYRSTVDGKFHGCGHDGHAVTLLTAAAYLAKHDCLEGDVAFIFQPAEELLAGARAMIEDGFLERYPLDEVYALHNLPGLAPGHVGVVHGGALASSDRIAVAIHADGTHGSAPHTGQDGIMAAAMFLTTLQQTVTRVIDSRDSGVISFGRIAGGQAANVLPEHVEIEGSMRTHDASVRDRLVRQIEATARSIELTCGVKVATTIESAVPVTMNSPVGIAAALASASRVVGTDRIADNVRAVMASEDFSLFLERVPGAFIFIGQDGAYCHHPEYVFDPAVIPVGASLLVDLAISRAAESGGDPANGETKLSDGAPRRSARKTKSGVNGGRKSR